MTKRKHTPTVDFNSWLTGEEAQPDPVQATRRDSTKQKPVKKPATVKPIKKESAKVIKKEKPLSAPTQSGLSAAELNPKIKATFHIDTLTAEYLDAIQYRLKKLTGLRGHAISKSKILDTMMQLMHRELKAEEQHSRLYKAVIEQSTGK